MSGPVSDSGDPRLSLKEMVQYWSICDEIKTLKDPMLRGSCEDSNVDAGREFVEEAKWCSRSDGDVIAVRDRVQRHVPNLASDDSRCETDQKYFQKHFETF